MNKRVVAPAVGVVLALLAAACGGGGDGPAPAPPPDVPAPPPAAAATVANSVAQVKSDMNGAHEAMPAGSAPIGPVVSQRTRPAGAVALGGFGELYVAAGNTSTNTRVQLRNFETYVLSQSTGKWKRVQYSERVKGASYAVNYGTTAAAAAVRSEASGGISVRPAAGAVFRFWPESGLARTLVETADIVAVFTTVQTRLIVDSPAAADDRAAARLVVGTAADWRNSMTLYANPVPSATEIRAGTPVGAGKLRLVEADWRAMNFAAASDGQIDALGVKQEATAGATKPLANSEPLIVPPAKRVIVIGDSISEGNTGHDSYRRPLWNGIVADASNPLIDFVGTRKGVMTVTSNCDIGASTSNGTPVVPEFDQDHQAYWGWCVDDVNAVLPARLSELANDFDRRPDIALVHLGTNDIHQQLNPPAVVRGELSTLIATLRNANPAIRILLAQLIPMTSGDPSNDAEISALNAEILSLATSLHTPASPITVVDQFTGFDSADRYDGLHPNDAGEQKMAAKWLPELKAALQ
jgi:acyl-CoA thioesterase-1